MTTIINNNANNILFMLMKLFPRINNNQFFKNQIKMMIYLYLTDTPASFSNPYFFIDLNYTTVLIKYARFIETQMTYFHDSISENKEYLYLNTLNSNSSPDFSKKKFTFCTSPKKTQKKPIISFHHRLDNNYTKNVLFIKQFMKPYTNFTSPVSIKIFDITVKINEFQQNIERCKAITKQNSFSDTLFHISVLQQNILKNTITSNPATEDVDKQIKIMTELNKYVLNYTNELNKQKETHLYLSSSLKKEKQFKALKEYCQRTILLNVDKMVSTLNQDVLNHIKSFIKPLFLENIRRGCIREKYFAFPRQKVNDILTNMTVNQLHMLCKSNLSLLYDMNEFNEETNLNQITDVALFMQYYQNYDAHSIFDTYILQINKKKKIIRKILENNDIVNYYEFQRDLFILNKIFAQRRRNF
jgi:hypothetical protein